MYGNKCISLRQVYRWVSKLKNGKTDLKDKQRPGACRTKSTDAKLAKITDSITNDGRLTIKQIDNLVGILLGIVFTVLKKHIGLRKVSAR